MNAAGLGASIIGSQHCVAMCGPLIGMCGGGLRIGLVHAAGRFATYVVLGVVAGALGHAIDLGPVQRAATLVAGAAILGWGGFQLAVALGVRLRPRRSNVFGRALVRLRAKRPGARAYWTGVLTGLLPCGWLWAFVVAAGGTGSPLEGGVVMATFWLGTVPAMVGLLALAGPVIGWVRARMPVVTALVLIGLGVGTLAMRWDAAGVVHCARCGT
jgi:uncharacterized protein